MFDNWLKTVSIDDTVLHLGDLTFNVGILKPDFNILPGKKFLIKGNHDHKKDHWYEENGFTVVTPEMVEFQQGPRKIIFTHYPETAVNYKWDINIHGHIHNNGYVVKLTESGRIYINVSVEVMNYTPTKLRDILKEV